MDVNTDMNRAIEMSIVDLFTKMIFGQVAELSERELSIIQALRLADDNISMDSYQEMGVYLRALGVQEMIGLVSRVKQHLDRGEMMPLVPSSAQSEFHA